MSWAGEVGLETVVPVTGELARCDTLKFMRFAADGFLSTLLLDCFVPRCIPSISSFGQHMSCPRLIARLFNPARQSVTRKSLAQGVL